MKIALRAASGPAVGSGHVRRTRAVAQALRGLAAQVDVVLIVDDAETAARLAAEGFDARAADADESWARERWDAAWLDGFRDWSRALDALARGGARALLVENRVGRERASAVVQPSLHHEPDAWERAHADRVLGGARYVPLAREIEARAPLPPEARDLDLLITFGASDPERSTERALAALAGAGRACAVTVGVHMAARRAEIERRAARAGARVLAGVDDLGPWIARSRAAVTAVGTTLYELAHLRTPAWIVANYSDDAAALAFYARSGPHAPLGIARELPDAALAALRDPPPAARAWPELAGGAERLARHLAGR